MPDDSQLAPIVAEVIVPVTPTEAGVGFTAQMGEWWDPAVTPEPATYSGIAIDPDGPVEMLHGDEHFPWGRVMEWDPIGRYTQEFWLGHPEDEATVLDVRFTEAEGGATLVRLVHSGGLPGTEDLRAGYADWQRLLDRYAAHVS